MYRGAGLHSCWHAGMVSTNASSPCLVPACRQRAEMWGLMRGAFSAARVALPRSGLYKIASRSLSGTDGGGAGLCHTAQRGSERPITTHPHIRSRWIFSQPQHAVLSNYTCLHLVAERLGWAVGLSADGEVKQGIPPPARHSLCACMPVALHCTTTTHCGGSPRPPRSCAGTPTYHFLLHPRLVTLPSRSPGQLRPRVRPPRSGAGLPGGARQDGRGSLHRSSGAAADHERGGGKADG